MSYNWLKKSFWHFVNMERLKYYFISFTENSDAVYCFYCGIGLKEWKEGDTPWGEHAKWSPDCVFVRNIKGPDFIEMDRLKDSNPEEVNSSHQWVNGYQGFRIKIFIFQIITSRSSSSSLHFWGLLIADA